MTYLSLTLAFVVPAAVVAALAALVASRRGPLSTHWPAVGATLLALIVLTAVFDSIMIAAGLFSYTEDHLLGPRIGLAPIEDFAYPLVTAVLLPSLWLALRHVRATQGPATPGTTEPPRSTERLRAPESSATAHLPGAGLLRFAVVTSRPVSWINTAFPFAAAMLLTTREIDLLLVVGTVYFLIPYNLAMYGINDVFDYASDVSNPRKGGLEGGLLPPRLHRPMLWLVAVTNVPFLVALVMLGGTAVVPILAVSVFAVVAYSAPPWRFKERPVLDSVTSSIHFVSPALVGLAAAGAELNLGLTLGMVAFFLWGMAAHAFGAVQDVEPDRSAGIRSIATVFGARRTVRLALLLWALAGVVMLATPWPGPLAAVVAMPYLLNAAPFWRVTDVSAGTTNRAWRRFIWLNYASGFIVTLILIAIWMATPAA